jgi:uncharacterized membrane protein YkvA (DUF1232 family)
MRPIAGFWKKARSVGRGLPFIRHAVAMYYAFTDKDTPLWAKVTIVGALVYFISPADALPDWIPGLGFADDAAAIATALTTVRAWVSPTHYALADRWLQA